jgi:hypothetical protein
MMSQNLQKKPMTSLNPIGYDIIGVTQARMNISGRDNEDGS